MAGGDGSVAYVIKATRTLPHVQTLHLRSGGLGGSVEETRSYLDALDYITSQLSSVSPVSSFYHFTISLFSYFFMITSRGHRPIFWFVMIMMMIKMTHNDDMMIFHDTYTCQHSHELVMKP